MTESTSSIWKTASARWKELARVAAVVAAIAFSIFIPPPAYMGDAGEGTLVPFARYAVGVVAALIGVAMVRWRRKKYLRYWLVSAIIAFALVTITYFTYNEKRDRFTAIAADGSRVVIGTEYTPAAASYVRAQPSASAEQLLGDSPCSSGKAECSARLVWTEESIERNKRLLGLLFIAGAVLVDVALLSAVQSTLI